MKLQFGITFHLRIFMLGISTLNVSNTDGKHLLTLIRCLQIAPWQSHPLVIVVQIAKNEERTSHSRENFRAKTIS